MMKAHLHFRALPIQDVEGPADGGLAQVPLRAGVELPQLGLQGSNIHVLIVVKVAKPAENINFIVDKYEFSD